MIYFTADHHFFHRNIIKYCDRPFNSLEEMNEVMLQRWNSTIKPKDIIYYLGDLTFWDKKLGPQLEKLIRNLNGNLFVLPSSHCSNFIISILVKESVTYSIDHIKELNYQKQKIILCHYPLLSWNGSNKGSWQLHGHSHGQLKLKQKNQLDVGVDTHNFYPYSFDELKIIL